jgi:hypothetical protein
MARPLLIVPLAAGLLLAGCGEKTPQLPIEPLDRAATCGVVAAATERKAVGAKGDLPAESQGRILQYAMLYASDGKALDLDKVNRVSARMPVLFEQTIKGKWETLGPACAQAFPATQVKHPVLPSKPFDSMLQCYALADFLRKVRLDTKIAPLRRAAGLKNGPELRQKQLEELAAVAKLGQPPAVIAACEAKYPAPGK